MDSDPMFDDLDRQFQEFLEELSTAFGNARKALREVPQQENSINRCVLRHISWDDGGAINLGIMVEGWQPEETSDE